MGGAGDALEATEAAESVLAVIAATWGLMPEVEEVVEEALEGGVATSIRLVPDADPSRSASALHCKECSKERKRLTSLYGTCKRLSGGGSGVLAHHATTARAKCVCTWIVMLSYIKSKLRENIAISMLSSKTTTNCTQWYTSGSMGDEQWYTSGSMGDKRLTRDLV